MKIIFKDYSVCSDHQKDSSYEDEMEMAHSLKQLKKTEHLEENLNWHSCFGIFSHILLKRNYFRYHNLGKLGSHNI